MTKEFANSDESVFEDFFAEAGWDDIAKSPPNQRRIEAVKQRAIAETVMKESGSFIYIGFVAALGGIFAALFGSIKKYDEDYKP